MTKKSRQIFKYLKNEKSFMTFFIIFNGLSLKQIKYFFFWKVGVRLQGSIQKLFDTGIPVWAPKLLRPKKGGSEKSKVNTFVVCNHKAQQVQNHKRVNLTIKFKAFMH